MLDNMLGVIVRKICSVSGESRLGMLRDFLEKAVGKNGDAWWEGFGKFLRKENPWPVKILCKGNANEPAVVPKVISFITHTFTVPVDETVIVEEAVRLGSFDRSNESVISANFPKPAEGRKMEKEMALFHFGKNIGSKAVIARMDKVGYRPATIWDICCLAVKEPDLQRQFVIVALGSVAYLISRLYVAYLDRHDSKRILRLDWFDLEWSDSCRFLAVRK